MCTTLNDSGFIIESFDEAERDFVLWFTVLSDALPVALGHISEFLEWLQALPLESSLPIIEEATRPSFSVIAPHLTERFFEKIGSAKPLICR